MSRHRGRKPGRVASPAGRTRIGLLLAAPDGQVFEHPQLDLAIDDGVSARPAEPQDMWPLPLHWELMQLPGTRPLGFDPASGRLEVVERFDGGDGPFTARAVAVHPPPGHVRTHVPAVRSANDGGPRAGLPLWGYCAAGSGSGGNLAAMFQVDELSRWDPSLYDLPDLDARVAERLAAHPDNRVLTQLATCATDYHCRCSQNIFYQRWEGALPIAPSCNAACLGCLSRAPEWNAPVPQFRLRFTPTAEEIAEVIVDHVENAPEAMVSFGQGCEGEPTINSDVLIQGVQLARKQTARGVINLNTNGSRPDVVSEAVRAGVGAVRVSVNSFDSEVFQAYFRPEGYGLDEVRASLRAAHDAGAFTSINLLLWPGWTDRHDELEAVSALHADGVLDMVQLRNLCVDPVHYNAMLPTQRGQRLGLRGFVLELASRHPGLRFGTFNPRLASPWYRDLPSLPVSPLQPPGGLTLSDKDAHHASRIRRRRR
ncbi:MAG: radical SAM protein [Pseudomonadota bacterium]